MKRAGLLALPLLLVLTSCGESDAHRQASRNAAIVADATCSVEKGYDPHTSKFDHCVKALVRDYLHRWEAANPGR